MIEVSQRPVLDGPLSFWYALHPDQLQLEGGDTIPSTEPTERSTRIIKDGIEIDHRFGLYQGDGDVVLDAEGDADSFSLYLSRDTGRDSDNFNSSADAEIRLNEEEARELLLLLTVWIENR